MTQPRQINKLRKASIHSEAPFPTRRRVKGSAARGLAFQRKVHADLTEMFDTLELFDGPWIKYLDDSGSHWCQPDSLVIAEDRVLIVEAKLSLRRWKTALAQLQRLYRPAVEHIFQRPSVMCVAFNYWSPDADDKIPIIADPVHLLSVSLKHFPGPYCWHKL